MSGACRSLASPPGRGRASPSTPTSAGASTRPSSWMGRLAEFDPYWIEEPTSPDDVLGHRTIREAVRPIRVATGEHVQNRVIFKQLLQAEAIDVVQIDACRVGGVNENLAILLLAAKFGVPVCPHAGGVGLCEMVQHLAMFDFVAVSGTLGGPLDRVRRPPARALHRPGRRRGRPLPGPVGARRRRPAAGRLDRASSGSRTGRPGPAGSARDVSDRRSSPCVGPGRPRPAVDHRRRPWPRSGAASASTTSSPRPRPPASTRRSWCRPWPTSPRPRSCSTWPQTTPLIAGVVGYVDLAAPDVGEQLDRLRARPSAATGWSGSAAPCRTSPTRTGCCARRSSPASGRSPSAGLVYDLLIRAAPARGRPSRRSLRCPRAASCSTTWPSPPSRPAGGSPGRAGMAALAACENVSAKLSGLVTEAELEQLVAGRPAAVRRPRRGRFGPDRLLFGSDWPVCTLAATYGRGRGRGQRARRRALDHANAAAVMGGHRR